MICSKEYIEVLNYSEEYADTYQLQQKWAHEYKPP